MKTARLQNRAILRKRIFSGRYAATARWHVARFCGLLRYGFPRQSFRLLRTERLLAVMSGAFGMVALTLAAVGIGGVLAYAVARRTNEIGVRMALGAAAIDVIRMVLRDSVWMAGIGIVIGLPFAYAMAGF